MNPQGGYLEFENLGLFTFLYEPRHRENHYKYLGDFVDSNLEIFLFVLDINLNSLTKSKFQDNFTQINSFQYGLMKLNILLYIIQLLKHFNSGTFLFLTIEFLLGNFL